MGIPKYRTVDISDSIHKVTAHGLFTSMCMVLGDVVLDNVHESGGLLVRACLEL